MGMENRRLAINHWLHSEFREPLKPLIPDDGRYSHVFDKFKVIASLAYSNMQNPDSTDRFPLGSYILRQQDWTRVVGEIEGSIRSDTRSEFVESGVLGDTAEDCLLRIEQFKKWVPKAARDLGVFY